MSRTNNIKLFLFAFLGLTCLLNSVVSMDGVCSWLKCLERQIKHLLQIILLSRVSGELQDPDTLSWDLFWYRLVELTSSLGNTVMIGGKRCLSQTSILINSMGLTGRILFLATLYVVMFESWLVIKVGRWLLLPVQFILRGWWNLLTWPIRSLTRTLSSALSAVKEWVYETIDWVLTRPQAITHWTTGYKAVAVEAQAIAVPSLLEKMDELLAAVRGPQGTVFEAIQRSSPFTLTQEWPKGLVVVRNDKGSHIGMGFLHVFRGKWCLVTAAHVMTKCTRGVVLSAGLGNNLKHVTIADSKIMFQSTLDVVAIEVPANTASALGVKKATLGASPAISLPINVYGYHHGEFKTSVGTVEAVSANFGLQHSASTVEGFSGTPIYRDGTIVGIHSRSNSERNYFLSLDFMVVRLEAQDYTAQRFARQMAEYDEEEHGDAERYIEWMWEQEETMQALSGKSNWAYRSGGKDRARLTSTLLSNFVWRDESPLEYGSGPTLESFPGFPKAPQSGGAVNTSSGRVSQEILSQTTSSTSVNSTSSIQEAVVTPVSQRKKRKNKSKRSKGGNGHKEESQPLAAPSATTPEGSKRESGSPPAKEKTGSEPKSWTQIYTQELVHRLGTSNGSLQDIELVVKEAKIAASKIFPRSPEKVSEQSVPSSSKTL